MASFGNRAQAKIKDKFVTSLLLAPAGHGKTERVVQRVRRLDPVRELVARAGEQTVKMGL